MRELRKSKILVIENEPQTLSLLVECLEDQGFDPIGANTGLLGIQQAQQNPDSIICDISLPDRSGYDILEALRQDSVTAVIPFIFLTGKVSYADIRRGMELGADDYLIKPCLLKDLVRAINIQLEKRAKLQSLYAARNQVIVSQPPAKNKQLTITHSLFPSGTKWNEVFEFIESNYHKQITLSEVAKAVGYSPAYLTNLIAQDTGNSVHNWIIKRRMLAASSLLTETKLSVSQIADAVGYQDASYFCQQFRQYYGMSPKAWRNNKKTAPANELLSDSILCAS